MTKCHKALCSCDESAGVPAIPKQNGHLPCGKAGEPCLHHPPPFRPDLMPGQRGICLLSKHGLCKVLQLKLNLIGPPSLPQSRMRHSEEAKATNGPPSVQILVLQTLHILVLHEPSYPNETNRQMIFQGIRAAWGRSAPGNSTLLRIPPAKYVS